MSSDANVVCSLVGCRRALGMFAPLLSEYTEESFLNRSDFLGKVLSSATRMHV